MKPHIAPKYGEYVDLTATVTFTEEELSPDNAFFSFLFHEPEPGVDITLDSFDFFLPSESSYPDPNALCDELVFNGNAEGNGFNPYPFITTSSSEKLLVIEEDGNKFFRLANRNDWRRSIEYKLDTTCLTRGVTYMISSRVRYRHSEGFVGGYESYFWYIDFERASDGVWKERKIVNCEPQSAADGWVTCSGVFIVDEEMAESMEAELKMQIGNSRDGGKYDLDYDDISISYHQGYVDELVVDSDDVSCWGPGAETHITTATYYSTASEKSNGFESQIASTVDNGDGTTIIQLDKATTLPIISEEDNSGYAVDIALLSRNVIVQGESGEDKKGGYMQVFHTSMIAQTIQGVEFKNMGRYAEVDKFVSDMFSKKRSTNCTFIY